MKIGARTIKSGIAIALALIIPPLLHIPDGSVLAGISAIMALQPSTKRSYIQMKNRIIGNTIGGIVATVFTLLLGNHFFVVGFACTILIAILHQLKLDSVIGNAVVTTIVIMFADADAFIPAAILRVTATFIGVIIAFLVNQLVFPPKYEEKLYHLLDFVTSEIMKWLRASVRKNTQFDLLKKDLNWIHSEIVRVENYFTFMKEEGTPFLKQKDKVIRSRRLVIYRQLIQTTKMAYRLASTLQASENVFNHFSDDLRILIRERVEVLLTAHEQIILKFNGRVNPEDVNFIAYKADLRKEFMTTFFNEARLDAYLQDDYGDSNSVIHIMSDILVYEENLILLNRVVSSYRKYDWSKDQEIGNIKNMEQ